jgi:hypothetical protein
MTLEKLSFFILRPTENKFSVREISSSIRLIVNKTYINMIHYVLFTINPSTHVDDICTLIKVTAHRMM